VFQVARKTQQVASWSRDCVSRGAQCTEALTTLVKSSPKSRLRFSEYRFYPFGSEILLIFTYGILLQINFILLRVTLLLAMTY